MSLEVLTASGGGGEFASIFVTGLSETDTVSASKDGKTVNGVWGQKTVKIPSQIPAMTSNTTPSGVASASSYLTYNGTPLLPYRAFDGTAADWVPDDQSVAHETYLQYEFDRPVFINSIYARISGDSAQASVNFTFVFQGSIDGTAWENITEEQTHNAQIGSELNLPVSGLTDYKFLRLQLLGSDTGLACVMGDGAYLFDVSEVQVDAYYNEPVSGFSISPIKKYGTWTVTATDGEQTATQDVLVDAAVEFEIEMDYKLWLYRDGDEFEDITGGFSPYALANYGTIAAEPTLVKGENSMTISIAAGTSRGIVSTNSKVAVSGFTKLCAEFSSIESTQSYSFVGVTVFSQLVNTYNPYILASNDAGLGVASYTDKTIEVDVSGVDAEAYIAINILQSTAVLERLWLE